MNNNIKFTIKYYQIDGFFITETKIYKNIKHMTDDVYHNLNEYDAYKCFYLSHNANYEGTINNPDAYPCVHCNSSSYVTGEPCDNCYGTGWTLD